MNWKAQRRKEKMKIEFVFSYKLRETYDGRDWPDVNVMKKTERTDRRRDRHHTVALRFPLLDKAHVSLRVSDAASVTFKCAYEPDRVCTTH